MGAGGSLLLILPARAHKRSRYLVSERIVSEPLLELAHAAPHQGRVLGIDYGERRVGIALSDESQLIAQALVTLERRRGADVQLYQALSALVHEHEAVHIVIGWPLRLNGREGIQTQKVERFIKALTPHIDVEISRWDERMTTNSAERALREGGVRGARQRAKVDQVAAALILRGWLDARAHQRARS